MATIPTQLRIDSTIKQQATELFASLGMDMSSAVNIFLHQCVLRGGLPFSVEIPAFAKYDPKILEAMAEARKISQEKDSKANEFLSKFDALMEGDDDL